MDSYGWAQIITLGLAIAVLVILIVVLTRNNLTPSNDKIGTATTVAALGAATQESMIKEDNKVNWLYGLAIAEAGIVCVFGVLTLLAMIRWSKMVKA
jgi:hypothetical protein